MARISHGCASSMHTWHIDDVLERTPRREEAESLHSHTQLPPERQAVPSGMALYILTSLQRLQEDLGLLKALGEISSNLISGTNTWVHTNELTT